MKWHHKKEFRLYKKDQRRALDHLVSFRRRLDQRDLMIHPFAVNHEHVSGVVHEDENSLRNRLALNAALRFWCMDRDNVTVVDAFDMVDRVIAFLSGAKDTYESTGTATQSEGGTTSTVAARRYGRKGKQPRVEP
ncbi:hypothetical protein Scep_021621 [Stephania cephalantha]|uniref:Uncharacterized protein n=1 Tax=Stephania cephalantha TaxID=152367 RepID=A0AAP0F9A2_9MAGN